MALIMVTTVLSSVLAPRVSAHEPVEILTQMNTDPSWTFQPFVSNLEKNFEISSLLSLMQQYYFIAPISCVFYIATAFTVQHYMKNKPPYDLRRLLQLWNLILSVFSFMGMIRIVPGFLMYIYQEGFRSSLCSPTPSHMLNGAMGFWSAAFVFSKYAEFLDTAFIVLRKRNLTFLHWYHHTSVVICSWFAFLVQQPAAFYFCSMNYTVHAVMYSYYFLAAVLTNPPTWGIYVTLFQILQMAAGCFITISALIYSHSFQFKYPLLPFQKSHVKPNCAVSRPSLYACTFMYISYLYLFSVFFFGRYIKKGLRKKKHL